MKPRELASHLEAAWQQIDREAYRIESLQVLLCFTLQALPVTVRALAMDELNQLRLAHEAYSSSIGDALGMLETELRAAGRLPRE